MRSKNSLKGIAFSLIGLVSTFSANASLGLSPTYPDLTSFSMSATYTVTCSDSSGAGARSCGTDNGLKGKSKINYDTYLSGQLVLDSELLLLQPTGASSGGDDDNGGYFVVAPAWTLTADFDINGAISAASILSTGATNHSEFQTGSLVASNAYTGFAFDGIGNVGGLEFTFGSATGDLPLFAGDANVGVIVTLTGVAPNPVADWSVLGNDFWKTTSGFTADGYADTFALNPQLAAVPVPPSALLFVSGLFGLFFKVRKA